MQMQVEAERRKRAAILESEGVREAEINIAEGKRKSRILASGKRHRTLPKCSRYSRFLLPQRPSARSILTRPVARRLPL